VTLTFTVWPYEQPEPLWVYDGLKLNSVGFSTEDIQKPAKFENWKSFGAFRENYAPVTYSVPLSVTGTRRGAR
jgi:hypothetical protein